MFKALLIGQSSDQTSGASVFLRERGCEIRCTSSFLDAWSELEAARFDFDLVLSPIRMGKSSGLHLADLLEGAAVTLFYSYAVEEGTWWMPALRDGKKCFGTAALRSGEFGTVLDEMIQAARIRKQLGRISWPSRSRRAAG